MRRLYAMPSVANGLRLYSEYDGAASLAPRCYRQLGLATYETLGDVWFDGLPQLPVESRDVVRWDAES